MVGWLAAKNRRTARANIHVRDLVMGCERDLDSRRSPTFVRKCVLRRGLSSVKKEQQIETERTRLNEKREEKGNANNEHKSRGRCCAAVGVFFVSFCFKWHCLLRLSSW